MAQDSWPNGVTSWNDTVKFAQLVFGKDVKFENYSERLPHPSNKSFLLFAKGACGEGTPLYEVADLVEPQLEEICSYEKNIRRNTQRPNKSQQMLGSDNSTIHYWSAQLTRAPCTCRSVFGADAHQKHAQTCSDIWKAGGRFAKLWEATLLENLKMFGKQTPRPIWLDKTWQAVWNWNDHNQGHGIVLHADESETYSSLDPITSLSFGRGGVLTLSAKKSQAFKMLFQEDGDALVMAGNFQEEFWHGVPERSRWKDLRTLPLYDAMQAWEKAGFDYEVQLHEMAKDGEKHVRVNCTMRWHATHWEGCPNRHVRGTQPVSTGTVRTSKSSPDNVAGNLSLAGFKRSTSTADIADDSSSVKTPRSLDSQSMELVQSLLGLVDMSGQVPMARTLIAGIPLIGSKGVHDEGLATIEEQMLECRARLFKASHKCWQNLERSWRQKWTTNPWTPWHWRRDSVESCKVISALFTQKHTGIGWLKRISIRTKIVWPKMVVVATTSIWCHINAWNWRLHHQDGCTEGDCNRFGKVATWKFSARAAASQATWQEARTCWFGIGDSESWSKLGAFGESVGAQLYQYTWTG